MDKHTQITKKLSNIVSSFYKSKTKVKQGNINQFKK